MEMNGLVGPCPTRIFGISSYKIGRLDLALILVSRRESVVSEVALGHWIFPTFWSCLVLP
jgi:hypothetical protein